MSLKTKYISLFVALLMFGGVVHSAFGLTCGSWYTINNKYNCDAEDETDNYHIVHTWTANTGGSWPEGRVTVFHPNRLQCTCTAAVTVDVRVLLLPSLNAFNERSIIFCRGPIPGGPGGPYDV